jgi:predicted ferric reductase
MRTHHIGNLVITLLALLNVALWLIFPPPPDDKPMFLYQLAAEIMSTTAMVLMACGFILALRLRVLEPYFGGLDRMYKSHKTAALTGMFLIGLHFFLMPITFEAPLGNRLGIAAFWGLMILVLLALTTRIPIVGGYIRLAYHQWRFTHRFIGVFYIIGILHKLNVDNLLQYTPIPNYYFEVIVYAGAGAYLYKELLSPWLQRPRAFVVEAARQLNASTLEVTLKPNGAKPPQTAGQFLFVSFAGDPTLAEAHPFTVSSAPAEPHLRLSIKASGDWTRHLYSHLKPGAEARVDGCYGRFNYKTGGAQQIWIAGGIGITPFLSWVRDFDGEPRPEIDFFYTVRAEAEALFWDEMQAAAQKYLRFRAHLTVSSRDGSLSTHKIVAVTRGKLAEKHVYLCGPLPMTEGFRKQFRIEGVPAQHIHFEEFNFR